MNIYVGNILYTATEADLETLFGEYGQVTTATIIRDRSNGRSKGFGFVEMENKEDGERAIEALDGQEMMGRPLKVNEARPREHRGPQRPVDSDGRQSDASGGEVFHNPYTFVPTPPRGHIKRRKFAGDFNPLENGLDHASLKPELWTGHIPIKLTTVTPLVLLKDDDGKKRDSTEHQTYDVLDYIPESSLRGMLRSAYEVVTNSRYGGFGNDHKEKFAYRMDTREAPKLIPAIIKKGNKPSKLVACLCTGTSIPTPKGPKRGGSNQESAMYAAMLTCYKNRTPKTDLQGNYNNPKTGDKVYAEIILCQKSRYRYWKASRVWRKADCSTKPTAGNVPSTWHNDSLYKDPNRNPVIKVVEGTVLITNENIDRKHDERIFFNPLEETFDITDNHTNAWKKLIKNYRGAHSDEEIFNRKDENGNSKKPWHWFKKSGDRTEWAWAPHLYHKGGHEDRWGGIPHDALDLKEDDMVYARCEFDENENISGIKDLFPVTISRELYENSPEDLLDASLRPAKKLDELSPADRLFGWVPQNTERDDDIAPENEGGYKSRIRVVCEDGSRPEIVQRFECGGSLPLTILGQPKPAQGRFYVAQDSKGTPQHGKSKKDAGYNASKGKSLRGRKQYWHHAGLEAHQEANKPAKDYWEPSVEDRTQVKRDGRYQEYRRPDKNGQSQQDSQSRFIKGWIKPDTGFKASLYVQNLQPEEVGALLWLLTLPEDRYFKLGYGKPLGFGSMRLEVDNGVLPLGTRADWKEYYSALEAAPPATLNENQRDVCIQAFRASMESAYNMYSSFDKLPFIANFLQILKGPVGGVPIHYPRLEHPEQGQYKPNPEGKNYEWFTANERGRERNEDGRKCALPATDKGGLPYNPTKPKER